MNLSEAQKRDLIKGMNCRELIKAGKNPEFRDLITRSDTIRAMKFGSFRNDIIIYEVRDFIGTDLTTDQIYETMRQDRWLDAFEKLIGTNLILGDRVEVYIDDRDFIIFEFNGCHFYKF